MNQGRIWCVVSPTVGLPLFLGSVAITSLIVHTAILTHSSWYGAYVGANARAKTAMIEGDSNKLAAAQQPAFTVNISPSADATKLGAAAFVVTVSPNPAAVASAAAVEAPSVLAEATLR